jgi:hypothetical protein
MVPQDLVRCEFEFVSNTVRTLSFATNIMLNVSWQITQITSSISQKVSDAMPVYVSTYYRYWVLNFGSFANANWLIISV